MGLKTILFFALLTGGLLISSSAYADTIKITSESNVTVCSDAPMGTIVMLDEVLMVDSGNGNNPIVEIRVYDANDKLVHTESNCNSSKCSTSLRALPAGIYFVKVIAENDDVFTGYVELK